MTTTTDEYGGGLYQSSTREISKKTEKRRSILQTDPREREHPRKPRGSQLGRKKRGAKSLNHGWKSYLVHPSR